MPKKTKEQQTEEISFQQEDIPTRATANKIYKSEKQKQVEERKDFVPITSPKITTEVLAKPRPKREEIEIIEKPKKTKNTQENGRIKRLKKAKRTTEQKISKIKKQIEELSGNSILIITEKPQAAAKISAALSQGKDKKHSDNGIPFYEFTKNNVNVIVACAVGHLFSLAQDVKGSNYPIFEVSWKPNFEVRKKDFTKKYYSTISRLVKRASEIIIATDYDIEGEVIGYNIVRFLAHQKDAKRMKFSSLTANELEEAFEKVHPTIDWGQAIAGETRHYIDWYYGINLSRALMNAIKTTGKFQIMSIGRVQGPALKMIVEKEREISKFKPLPFWRIYIDIHEKANSKNKIKLKYTKDIFNEKELSKFSDLKGKEAEVNTEKTTQNIIPPAPFDLTTLQTESYAFFGFTPSRTLEIAQELYLKGLISYPRTSSQKIPNAINPKAILKRLEKYFAEIKRATRDNPIEGKKSDPAHPSIYPTGEYEALEGDLKKVYELIARRFISCFSSDAIVDNKIISLVYKKNNEDLIFKERGSKIRELGWMAVYQSNVKEKEIEDMSGLAIIDKVEQEKDETKPPRRYSPASIISELEKAGLGTKATRANILETLYDRNYITDKKSIKATPFGINLIETLEKNSPIIIDKKLTHEMESNMEHLREAKKELEKKQQLILKKAQETIKAISEDFHKKENIIGKDLHSSIQDYYKQQQIENQIKSCDKCKQGMLTIKFSPKNRRYFIACNKYPECTNTFSLPPYGLIKKLSPEKLCDKCGFPLLMSIQKAKRPWIFCFNPECPSRKERQEKKLEEERQEEV